MRERPLVALLLLFSFLTAGCQQEYLRGYAAGMDRQDSFCKQVRRIDDLECHSELTDEMAKNKICEGVLAIYKAGKK